jgi:hypothetical protein
MELCLQFYKPPETINVKYFVVSSFASCKVQSLELGDV